MSELERQLLDLGFTKTEAKIYLAGLPYKIISVNELSKLTSIKRPTIYHAIGTLLDRGLVSKQGTKERLRFKMVSPENIHTVIEEKIKRLEKQEVLLKELLPILSQHQGEKKEDQAVITQYDGIKGIKTVVDMALYCTSKKWDIIAPVKNFFSEFEKEYADYYIKTRKEREIVSRSLWEPEMRPRPITLKEIKERNPRIMPKAMQGKFKSVLIIFDDKVAIISSTEKLSAILISSKEIFEMLSAIFDSLWEASEEFKFRENG